MFGGFFGKAKKKRRPIDLDSDPLEISDECHFDSTMSYSTCKTMLERLKELKIVNPNSPLLPKSFSTGSRGDLLSMINKVGFYVKQTEASGHKAEFSVVDGNFLRATCHPFVYEIARISNSEYLYALSEHKEPPAPVKEETLETAMPTAQEATLTEPTEEVERPMEGVGKVSAAERSLENAELFFKERNYVSAMEGILKVLIEFPHHRKALDLAQTILYLAMSETAEQKIPQTIIQDSLLDSVFAECSQCGAFWPVNPFLKDMAHVVVTHPVGGICETCGKVFCRKCAITDGLFLKCPQCKTQLGIIRTPMGRTRKLGKVEAGKKIVQVCIFKEAPEPPNMRGYVQLVLEALVPEALSTKDVGIYAETTRGEANETYAIVRTMVVKPGLDLKKYDVTTHTFTDRDGGRGIVLKVYEKAEG